MSCLVIKNDGIGDLILASGIISGLAEIYNGVDLVTCRENEEIASLIPGVNRIIYTSRDNIALGTNPAFCDSPVDDIIMLKLMEQQYPVAISLRRYIRQSTLVLQRLVNAEQKFCFWKYPGNATQAEAEEYSQGWNHIVDNIPLTNEADYYRNCLRFALGKEINPIPQLNMPAQRKRIPKSLVIGLSSSGKNGWNYLKWLKIAELFYTDGYKVHIVGDNRFSNEVDLFCNNFPGMKNHMGELTLTELLTLYQSTTHYMGNDTGISHLASLTVPYNLIIVGGGTIPRFFPWPGNHNQAIITHAMKCFDCNWECKYLSTLCMERIHTIDILPFAQQFFAGKQPPGLYNLGPKGIKFTENLSGTNNLCLDEISHNLSE